VTNDTRAEILAIGTRWASAEQSADTAALDELTAPDFRLVGPFGFVLDKAQWLDRYAPGELVTSSLTWDEVRCATSARPRSPSAGRLSRRPIRVARPTASSG
jgi:hypothetical protein